MSGTLQGLDEMADRLEATVTWLSEQVLDGGDAARLVKAFTRLERLASAGRGIVARRVADSGAWRAAGHRSPGDWLAAETKTSPAAASASLATMERLDDLPATKAAFTTGLLSEEQAVEIAAAAHADPTAEAGLLRTAERSTLSTLRKTAQAVRSAATRSQLADRDRVHRSRYFRHWVSADGAFEARCRLTADHGGLLLAALDAEHRLIFEQARATGRYESAEAYQADALVNLARTTLTGPDPTAGSCVAETQPGSAPERDDLGPPEGEPGRLVQWAERRSALPTCPARPRATPPTTPTPSGSAFASVSGDAGPPPADSPPRRLRLVPTVTVRVDHRALLRGWTRPGEVCELAGIGPVPVETARAYLSGDAVIRALLVDGDKVIDARSAGRTIPARLRAALEERDRTCVVPGCDTSRHLEIHHLEPFALSANTSLTNTARVCPYHHDQITYGQARLTGTPGNWRWEPGRPPIPGDGAGDESGRTARPATATGDPAPPAAMPAAAPHPEPPPQPPPTGRRPEPRQAGDGAFAVAGPGPGLNGMSGGRLRLGVRPGPPHGTRAGSSSGRMSTRDLPAPGGGPA